MTEKYLQEIEKCIQQASLDGALTESAIQQYHEMLAANEKLVGENKHQNELIVKKNEELSTLKERLNKYVQKEGVLVDREHEVKERETHMDKLELKVEYQQKRVEDHIKMVELIFRNSILRKDVMTPIPGLKQDQYGTSHSPYAQKDSVDEQET